MDADGAPSGKGAAWLPVGARRLPGAGVEAGPAEPGSRDTAEEIPVAFSFGGIAYAVMMATPTDLEDFAFGFTLTEGVAATAADIRAVVLRAEPDGFAVDVTLAPAAFQGFLSRRRTRALHSHTSCGLCGVEELADVPQPAGAVADGVAIPIGAIRAALASMRDFQPLSRRTRAAHAAVWAGPDGRILLAREDVGRHCALDKLIGAALRTGTDLAAGFCVVTSRCSFEMVQKAVAARMPVLVAVSAPTALAVRQARAAGLTLVAGAGADGQAVFSRPDRIGL